MNQDAAVYRSDCEMRGGEFNECGTRCAPDADMCAAVCAYTCENIDSEEEVGTISNSGDTDYDNDGLNNVEESEYGTDPTNPDTDGDGYTDGEEVENGFNPAGAGRL